MVEETKKQTANGKARSKHKPRKIVFYQIFINIIMDKKNQQLDAAIYELPNTKAVLKPLVDIGEEIAMALKNDKIDFIEWGKIALAGLPVIGAIQRLQAFVGETRILNAVPEARQQLYEWFAQELNIEGPEHAENIEWVVEQTISMALSLWSYIAGMKERFSEMRNKNKE